MKKINDFIKSKKGVISILSIIFILVLILNFLTIWAYCKHLKEVKLSI